MNSDKQWKDVGKYRLVTVTSLYVMEKVKVAKGDRDMLSWNLNELQTTLTLKEDNMLLKILILRPPKDIELNDMRVWLFQKLQDAKTLNVEGEDNFKLDCNHWEDFGMISC